jgi:chromosome segregation ATPase
MATATITDSAASPMHLSSSAQRDLDARINVAQSKVNVLEGKIREEQEKLTSAREIYARACELLAQGKSADVESARAAYQRHEAKIEGMKALLREPKQLLDQLKRELAAEVARADEARQSVAILDEQEMVEQQIERAMRAIDERNQLDQSIVAIVGNLRSRSYLTATNKQGGFQGAYRVERKAAGILN